MSFHCLRGGGGEGEGEAPGEIRVIYLEVGGEGQWPHGTRKSTTTFRRGRARAYVLLLGLEIEIMEERRKGLLGTGVGRSEGRTQDIQLSFLWRVLSFSLVALFQMFSLLR